jgi:SAM-dependent methyltransferase
MREIGARLIVVAMTTSHPSTQRYTPTAPSSSPWARVFALIYDPVLRFAEAAGMRRARKSLLEGAAGRVVEVGAGTGLNVPHYRPAVRELILLEPEPAMRRRLEQRVRSAGRQAVIGDASAEQLPLADQSVDTVVSTLVLCTVEQPDRALEEIARVLRPGGQLLFIEHVRAESPALAWLQDRLLGPWRRFACGCRCNRATGELMRARGFEVEDSAGAWRAMPPIVRPLICGRARVRGSSMPSVRVGL